MIIYSVVQDIRRVRTICRPINEDLVIQTPCLLLSAVGNTTAAKEKDYVVVLYQHICIMYHSHYYCQRFDINKCTGFVIKISFILYCYYVLPFMKRFLLNPSIDQFLNKDIDPQVDTLYV